MRQIVILRPRQQAQSLVEALASLPVESLLLPMISIEPLPTSSSDIDAIKQADIIIVCSQNAVLCASTFLIDALSHGAAKVITMGKSTSVALSDKGVFADVTAPKGSQSESLLAHECLQAQAIDGLKIAILAGKGGRTLLASTLTERGANVNEVHIYEQKPLTYDFTAYLNAWQNQKFSPCFVATSVNILEQLVKQFPNDQRLWLFSQPLVVTGERIRDAAKQFGFKQILDAQSAQADDIVKVLCKLTNMCNTKRGS